MQRGGGDAVIVACPCEEMGCAGPSSGIRAQSLCLPKGPSCLLTLSAGLDSSPRWRPDIWPQNFHPVCFPDCAWAERAEVSFRSASQLPLAPLASERPLRLRSQGVWCHLSPRLTSCWASALPREQLSTPRNPESPQDSGPKGGGVARLPFVSALPPRAQRDTFGRELGLAAQP